MLHRAPPSPGHSTPAAVRKARSEAQRRWRRNEREGKRLVRVPVDAAVLNWLGRHYPGKFNPDELSSVGALIGAILQASARAEL
jgi:hypothetical protein